jgi:thiamine-monophosphate kinase
VTVSQLTERELVARIQQQLPPAPSHVIVGIGDDAAVVEPERNRLEVLTVDAILDGVHFDRRFTPPHAIGHRALAVNLSDLAAMGASPRLALLSLALPGDLACDDLDAIIAGIADLAREHRVAVVGGNLTRTPGPLTLDITASGTVKRRGVLTRAGARAGDYLYVTGTLGAAAAGLQMLQGGPLAADDLSGRAPGPTPRDAHERTTDGVADGAAARYLRPTPRVKTGVLLGRNRAASACVDLSDGLADGLARLAEASHVGIAVEGGSVPVDEAARQWFERRGHDPLHAAVAGGDDYELLFTVRPRLRGRLRAVAQHSPVPFTRIGVCTADGQLTITRADGRVEPIPPGFSHFR